MLSIYKDGRIPFWQREHRLEAILIVDKVVIPPPRAALAWQIFYFRFYCQTGSVAVTDFASHTKY